LAEDTGDLDRVQEWLESGINSAFLTEEQAEIMMRALRGAEGGRLEITVDDDSGNVLVLKRKVIGDGKEVLLDGDFKGVEGGKPLAFAERSLAEQVATGLISQAEADTLLEEFRNGIWDLEQRLEVDGTIEIFSVLGEPVQVNVLPPDPMVFGANGASGAAGTEVVEVTLERYVEDSDE
jgi:hypothetical protein